MAKNRQISIKPIRDLIIATIKELRNARTGATIVQRHDLDLRISILQGMKIQLSVYCGGKVCPSWVFYCPDSMAKRNPILFSDKFDQVARQLRAQLPGSPKRAKTRRRKKK